MALSALAVAGGMTACGASSSTNTSGTSLGTGEQRAVAALTQFAGCARAHGIPVPDPNSQGQISGSLQLEQQYENTPQGQATLKACRSYLQNAASQLTPANSQQFRNAVLQSARCMRAHGILVPDPGPDGQINLGALASINQASPGAPRKQTRANGSAARRLAASTDAAPAGENPHLLEPNQDHTRRRCT